MYIYITLIFIFGWILYPIILKKSNRRIANLFFLGILFPVCSFAMGFRDVSVGIDTQSYKQMFDEYNLLSWHAIFVNSIDSERADLGFKSFMKICSEIYPNYYFFQIIFSLIYVFLNLKLIFKYTDNVVLVSAIFLGGGLYMQSFNIARQMLAVIIGGYAISSILNKKLLCATFYILLAYLFHSSAIILFIIIILYPLRKYTFFLKIAPFLFLISIFLLGTSILNIVTMIFGEKYISYILNDYSRPNSGILLKIMWLINFAIAMYTLYSKHIKEFILKYLSLISCISIACFIVGLYINFADRMGLYFIPSFLFLYDKISLSIKNKKIQYVYNNGMTAFFITFFTYWCFVNDAIYYKTIL